MKKKKTYNSVAMTSTEDENYSVYLLKNVDIHVSINSYFFIDSLTKNILPHFK